MRYQNRMISTRLKYFLCGYLKTLINSNDSLKIRYQYRMISNQMQLNSLRLILVQLFEVFGQQQQVMQLFHENPVAISRNLRKCHPRLSGHFLEDKVKEDPVTMILCTKVEYGKSFTILEDIEEYVWDYFKLIQS
uniref:Uncharacterized protein n=1 Tax=Glossina austeni TaxID=7395 RepID=A0A1A9VNU6_GLOAU